MEGMELADRYCTQLGVDGDLMFLRELHATSLAFLEFKSTSTRFKRQSFGEDCLCEETGLTTTFSALSFKDCRGYWNRWSPMGS
jgi:hypothetical protein